MTDAQQREAARQFYYKWNGKGKEDEDARSYWIDILVNIFGVENVTDRLQFEKKVASDKSQKRIDVYIPETHVLIEQKSLGVELDKPQAGHNGKTPYEQAKEYDNLLSYEERARWIVVSNFAEIWIYDMSVMKPDPVKITLKDLQTQYNALSFLTKKEEKRITLEMKLSIQAGEIVGLIHDRFLEQYNDPLAKHTQRSLNILCVRLVFCLYAEDAGLFAHANAFHDYIAQYAPKDIRRALIDLFEVLNTPYEKRPDMYLSDELNAFPYVNGGLFADENIVIPKITEELKNTLLESSIFEWSQISPTIFGAVFESTLNPETRRAGGMHYTSIENIHKVIDPLFLDDLKKELEVIRNKPIAGGARTKALKDYHKKLGTLKFFDPACGSGNFLTETYLSLRRLENQVIQLIKGDTEGQLALPWMRDEDLHVLVHIDQFYGIEINDFAVAVAKTALWIAESQMLLETLGIDADISDDFLPLSTNNNIHEGNALRMDWEKVVPKETLSYIMGNPPFRGHRLRSREQAVDLEKVLKDVPKSGKADYVCGWFYKAAEYIQGTNIEVGFVSTNSICQGESVGTFWKTIVQNKGVEIQFAHTTFVWGSEAVDEANVHCVIIGFCNRSKNIPKRLYENGVCRQVDHINAYLIAADDIFLPSRGQVITPGMPKMTKGNEATDGKHLSLTPKERQDIISKYPQADRFIKPYIGSTEFINNKERYCIWLKNVEPQEYRNIPPIMERLEAVRKFRAENVTEAVHKLAASPMLFAQIRQPETDFLLIPTVSSQRRRYIPMGFMSKDIIVNPKVLVVENANLYMFGVLESNVHMSWMRVTTGRLKSDFEYYPSVYNNFPWPTPTQEQRFRIEMTAQAILDARNNHPKSSLADLYDPLTMPPELKEAHDRNNFAVMKAYGMPIKETDEAACVAWLMRLYQEKTANS